MKLLDVYNVVDKLLDSIDFNFLFPGFKRYKFAVYNDKEVCLSGKMIPYNEKFLGNTCIEYNGEYYAIWNYGYDPVEDLMVLTYCMVHEMFHCFQKEKGYDRFPNDLIIFNYPLEYQNFNIKYNENLYLVNAVKNNDRDSFNKFLSLRNNRLLLNEEYVMQEIYTEELEGMAEYIGFKTLKQLNLENYQNKLNSLMNFLSLKPNMLFDIRRISYMSGVLFWLCLDIFGIDYTNVFNLPKTVFETLDVNADLDISVKEHLYLVESLKSFIENRKDIIDKFIEKSEYKAIDAQIVGYDPMNTFRYKNYLHCKNFIYLYDGKKSFMINQEIVLKMVNGSLGEITGYYISE